jgi:hypothetical protein
VRRDEPVRCDEPVCCDEPVRRDDPEPERVFVGIIAKLCARTGTNNRTAIFRAAGLRVRKLEPDGRLPAPERTPDNIVEGLLQNCLERVSALLSGPRRGTTAVPGYECRYGTPPLHQRRDATVRADRRWGARRHPLCPRCNSTESRQPFPCIRGSIAGREEDHTPVLRDLHHCP